MRIETITDHQSYTPATVNVAKSGNKVKRLIKKSATKEHRHREFAHQDALLNRQIQGAIPKVYQQNDVSRPARLGQSAS